MHQIRAVTLAGYTEVAAFVGLDGRRMLQEAGLTRQALEDPENRLPAAAVVKLLEDSAERSGCDSFGLLMAKTRSFASLGSLSLLLPHLRNVREVVLACIEFQQQLNDIITVSLEESDETTLIKFQLEPDAWSVQALDMMVAIGYRVLASASANEWRADCVHLVRPPPGDLELWRRFFNAPLEFESSFCGFSSSRAATLRPLPGADPAMAANARRLLEMVPVRPVTAPVSERVRRSITLLLPSGRATVEVVAASFGVSPRGLQRSLAKEGHRFGDLLDGVRRELAKAYLSNSTQPVTSVAAMLGYGSPSSFTRWFAGTFGCSPQSWREDNRSGT